MIKTGIFGGSFNPIHKGHIAICQTVCDSGFIDELWLMVSPLNPFKKSEKLLDDNLRLKLTKIAVQSYPNLKVSDFEFHLPRPSYMYNTLQNLRLAYNDREFTLIIGADNWKNFSRWYKAKEILEKYSLIIYPRKNFPIKKETLPINVHLLEMPLYTVSSTEIREKIRHGKDVSLWLEPAVNKELTLFLSRQ